MFHIIFIVTIILIFSCCFKIYKNNKSCTNEHFTYPIPMESALDTDHVVPADIAYEAIWPKYITKDGTENIMLRNALREKTKFIKQVIANSNDPLQEPKADIVHGLFPKAQGWWADTINCEQNVSNFYCKPKQKWIWPY